MQNHWLTCTGVVLMSIMTSAKVPPTPSPAMALMEDFWQWKIHNYPEFAMTIGITDEGIAGQLNNETLEDFQQKVNKVDLFVKLAQQLPPTDSEEDLLNINIFIEQLQQFSKNSKYYKFYTPVNFRDGPHKSFKFLIENKLSYDTYEDYINLLSLYDNLPIQVEESIVLMKGNIANGLMPSNWTIGGVIDQLEKLDLPIKETFMYKPFTKFPQGIFEKQKEQLLVSAQDVIENKALPAFRKLKVFIMEEYLPKCRAEIGISSLPGGKEFYQACLDFHTSTNLTAQQVHDIGLKEVQRIEAEAKKTAAEVGFVGMSIAEISKALQAEPSQKFASTQEVKKAFEDAAHKDIYPLLSNLLHQMPPPPLMVKPSEDASSGARYSFPSPDKPGIFHFNGPLATDIYRKYGVMALTLHEAAPGHHLQTTYMDANFPNLPKFRKLKNTDYSRKSQVPAIFALNTAFVEGWGLYSEYLGEEMGLYKDPYKKLGRYSFELLRACRLVVDTGMHALGWSRDKALQYLINHTFQPESGLINQINRYILWPGQATAYKIGEIKIKELRKKAENYLGRNFDIRDFHHILLRCSGPFTYVEKCVDDFILKNCC